MFPRPMSFSNSRCMMSSLLSIGGSTIPPRKLVLHFDINKTIIMSDPVSNISIDHMLNSLLCESIWGIVDVSNVDSNNSNGVNGQQMDDQEKKHKCALDAWKMCSTVPSPSPPPGMWFKILTPTLILDVLSQVYTLFLYFTISLS